MTVFLIIIMMVLIGAIIGGVTNSLAIKMLFRPYEAKYIGRWKIPFTPGLIPKRRDELARQLGKTVVDHLLTADGIKKKLNQADFQQQLVVWAQTEWSQFLDKNTSTTEVLAKFGIYLNEQQLKSKIASVASNQYENIVAPKRSLPLRQIIGEDRLDKIEEVKSEFSSYLQKQLIFYLDSEDAKRKIGQVVDDYLDGKGFLGNMISSFLGNDGLANQIQPVLIQFVQSQDAKDWMEQLLTKELEKLLDQPVEKVEALLDVKEIGDVLGTAVANNLPIEGWLKTTVGEWLEPYKEQILSHIIPTTVFKITDVLVSRLDHIMENFHLEEVVEKEVESFPTERVEELVLNISRREFKMITYLGAVLGGLIGLVQGVIVIMIG